MKKGKNRSFRRIICLAVALTMVLTSVPGSWTKVAAAKATKSGAVASTASNYHKMRENASTKPATKVAINNKISSMAIGEKYDLNESYLPRKSKDSVNWTSNNTKVATVNKNGVVTAKANGTVKITAKAVNGKGKDSVTIKVSNSVKAATQQDINRLLKAKNASTITIDTKKNVVLKIPAGVYSSKKLVVNAKNATIENKGTFDSIVIHSIKLHTWKEFAQNNKIHVCCDASVIIGKNVTAEVIIDRSGVNVTVVHNGKGNIEVNKKCNLSVQGTKKASVKVNAKAADSKIKTSIPVQMELSKKVTLEFANKEAAKSEIKAKNEKAIPIVIGKFKIIVTVGNKKFEVSINGAVVISIGDDKKDNSDSSTNTEASDTGYDKNGRIIALFGSPAIDGNVDDIWANAKSVQYLNVIPQAKQTTATTATIKVMWDDNAIYFLAQVKDPNVSDDSMQVYEKDSVEFFLDQDNHRNGTYEGDDSQFRINFKNELSCDHGDLSNLYSAAKITEDGYLVEGRIALSVKPENNVVMGMESQINCATGASREACISIFDKTGTAYQDTSKFGEVVFTGKTKDSVTKPNFYDLKSAISEAKKINLERYINGAAVRTMIEDSEKAIADVTTTQAKFDELLMKLNKATDELIHNDKVFADKECREIPKKYKTSASQDQQGTLDYVTYSVKDFQTGNDIDKSMMVYVPYGYNKEDNTKKYNVLYLVHGMAENQFTPLGYPGGKSELARVVDHLIAEGKMDPMIIVSPTWYLSDQNNSGDNLNSLVKNFKEELVNTIIPKIEGTYHTYAESTSAADLKAAREHRAFGGFSMGGNCTWYRFIDSLDYFKYFVPVSMWTWVSAEECKEAGATGDTDNDIIADYLSKIPEKYGYGSDDFYIFGATGTADLASPGMPNQIEAMKKKTDTFKYCGDIRNGNMTFIHYPGGAHNWTCVDLYLYNILPDLFKTAQTFRSDAGLDKDRQIVAAFGSPYLDGKEDELWSKAEAVKPQYVTTPENTKVTFKTMWDDNALYILAKVYDENISKASTNPYEQDSLEVFMDQNNDKTKEFGVDDLQFRCNFANDTTADKGDISRLCTKTSTFEGGYIIEERIEFDGLKPENGTKLGIELQINDGKGTGRAGTLNVFDGTGNAWQDTSVFGTAVLTGKKEGDTTPYGPYRLLSLIDSTKKLHADEYKNWEDFKTIIEQSQAVADNPESTEMELEAQWTKLNDAMNGLEYTEEAKRIKRYTVMPSEYKGAAISKGTIVNDSYEVEFNGEVVTKHYNVYLPAGYHQDDKEQKYNVFYLMHGGGENENTLFGGPGQELELKRIIDIMIEKGDIEPMIVVTPTFYNHVDEKGNRTDADIDNFYKELQNIIIPKVESTYNTAYGEAVDNEEENKARMNDTREHRAFGGFSMGSACTWYTFINSLDYIKYYVPLSGDCWAISGSADNTKSAETAEYLANVVKDSNYNNVNGFKLLCATGSNDIAYPNMNPQMQEMKKLSEFVFDKDTTIGNTYFIVADGGTHAWNFVNQYLYNILPDLFK
ncbi:sugar-binding protein [[Clostridium] polysaccharolyticum]|uniref:Enterochelin esterase n=1 Tax=[Clostridium] polysaccharolyticum TaxID=29364 RepID=A0A1I0FAB6_9FIRM|nr:sugar-binding protein [[Clostridium] polysaccharolyticum]SET54970.1 Enterochelin esterase [[Clostridium] polysaccharolyticum]